MISISLLNLPKSLGIDREGHIYVHDSGNNYIRKIVFPFLKKGGKDRFKEARIQTMYQGACRDLPNNFM